MGLNKLQDMLDMLPDASKGNRSDWTFIVSMNVYDEVKDELVSGKYMGIKVIPRDMVEDDKVYLY